MNQITGPGCFDRLVPAESCGKRGKEATATAAIVVALLLRERYRGMLYVVPTEPQGVGNVPPIPDRAIVFANRHISKGHHQFGASVPAPVPVPASVPVAPLLLFGGDWILLLHFQGFPG